ncbi:hypothetical protein H257_04530 [Aphanomyces astaci]|uniref:Uncharacterized protein n=1 Tax=Aphanomyces astaci TaxID=112090 RepID=W4GUM1_APHAT|nr:hypothetical protein H257_04530 [Aphanomyces astaci]ETV82714.1 hypothetical protein H257_04530 [Aphanomyces astaci]|eukprot:XP_009827385.1 hypothetical protein H257_04530 [Aphanomyces astaci]
MAGDVAESKPSSNVPAKRRRKNTHSEFLPTTYGRTKFRMPPKPRTVMAAPMNWLYPVESSTRQPSPRNDNATAPNVATALTLDFLIFLNVASSESKVRAPSDSRDTCMTPVVAYTARVAWCVAYWPMPNSDSAA